MKIQLDTTTKTIKVEESVNLNDFFEAIKRILPDGEWKEFKLETQTVINWGSPIVINQPYRQYYPWYSPEPYYTCGTNFITNNHTLTSGIYNIEC